MDGKQALQEEGGREKHAYMFVEDVASALRDNKAVSEVFVGKEVFDLFSSIPSFIAGNPPAPHEADHHRRLQLARDEYELHTPHSYTCVAAPSNSHFKASLAGQLWQMQGSRPLQPIKMAGGDHYASTVEIWKLLRDNEDMQASLPGQYEAPPSKMLSEGCKANCNADGVLNEAAKTSLVKRVHLAHRVRASLIENWFTHDGRKRADKARCKQLEEKMKSTGQLAALLKLAA